MIYCCIDMRCIAYLNLPSYGNGRYLTWCTLWAVYLMQQSVRGHVPSRRLGGVDNYNVLLLAETAYDRLSDGDKREPSLSALSRENTMTDPGYYSAYTSPGTPTPDSPGVDAAGEFTGWMNSAPSSLSVIPEQSQAVSEEPNSSMDIRLFLGTMLLLHRHETSAKPPFTKDMITVVQDAFDKLGPGNTETGWMQAAQAVVSEVYKIRSGPGKVTKLSSAGVPRLFTKLKPTVVTLEARLKDSDAVHQTQEKSIDTLNENLADVTKRLEDITKLSQERAAIIPDLQKQIEEQTTAISELDTRRTTLEGQLQEETALNARLEKQLEDQTTARGEMDKRLVTLGDQLQDETALKALLQKHLEDQTTVRSEMDKRLATLEEQLQGHTAIITNLQKQIKDQTTDKSDMDKRRATLQSQLQDEIALKALLQKQFKDQTTVRSEMDKRLATLEDQLQGKTAIITDLQKQIKDQTTDKSDMDKRRATLQSQLQDEIALKALLQKQLKDQIQATSDMDKRRATLQNQLKDETASKALLQKQIKDQTAAASDVQDELSATKQKLKAREADVADKLSEVKALSVGANIWTASYRRRSSHSDATVVVQLNSIKDDPLFRVDNRVFSESLAHGTDTMLTAALASFTRGGGRRLRVTARELSITRVSTKASRFQFVGACLRSGDNRFKIYGRFGVGMDPKTLEEVKQKLGWNKIMVQCRFASSAEGVSSTMLSDVVAAYPRIMRDAISRATAPKDGNVPALSVEQITFPTADKVLAHDAGGLKVTASRFTSDLTYDGDITFLLRVLEHDLKPQSSSQRPTTHELDEMFIESPEVLRALVMAGLSKARGAAAVDDFSSGRIMYRGLAFGHRRSDCCPRHQQSAGPPSRNFGVGLDERQLLNQLNETPDCYVLVHFRIVGIAASSTILDNSLISAQEAFHLLREELPNSRKSPIGSAATIVFAANTVDRQNQDSTMASSSNGKNKIIPVWLIVVCLLVPVLVFAVIFGVIWESKKLSCGCMPRYGVDVDSLPESRDCAAEPNISRNTSGASRAWVHVSKAIDRFVVRHFV
eukprot:GHVS01040019.1.p1 GENE.GHVS01040019.1~~GHVS01040019.1.p1  ORF type:complete len:1054 (+),score=103.28 GHVS01040019.1:400-3561(+)